MRPCVAPARPTVIFRSPALSNSEMLLGPMAAGVEFIPKHKSNSYGADKAANTAVVEGWG